MEDMKSSQHMTFLTPTQSPINYTRDRKYQDLEEPLVDSQSSSRMTQSLSSEFATIGSSPSQFDNHQYDPYQFPSNIFLALAHQQVNVIETSQDAIKQLIAQGFVENDVLTCPCCNRQRNLKESMVTQLEKSQSGQAILFYKRIVMFRIVVILVLSFIMILLQIIVSISNKQLESFFTAIPTGKDGLAVSIFSLITVFIVTIAGFLQIRIVDDVRKLYDPINQPYKSIISNSLLIQGLEPPIDEEVIRNTLIGRLLMNKQLTPRQINPDLFKISKITYYQHVKPLQRSFKKLEIFLEKLNQADLEIKNKRISIPYLPTSVPQANAVLVEVNQTPYLKWMIDQELSPLQKVFFYCYISIASVLCCCCMCIYTNCLRMKLKQAHRVKSNSLMEYKFADLQVDDIVLAQYKNESGVTIKMAPLPWQIDYLNIHKKKKGTCRYALKITVLQFIGILLTVLMIAIFFLFQAFVYEWNLEVTKKPERPLIEDAQDFYLAGMYALIVQLLCLAFMGFFNLYYRVKRTINLEVQLKRILNLFYFFYLGILTTIQICIDQSLQITEELNHPDSSKQLLNIASLGMSMMLSNFCTSILDFGMAIQIHKRRSVIKQCAGQAIVPMFQKTLQEIYTPLSFPLLLRMLSTTIVWHYAVFFIMVSPIFAPLFAALLYIYLKFDERYAFKQYKEDKRWTLDTIMHSQQLSLVLGLSFPWFIWFGRNIKYPIIEIFTAILFIVFLVVLKIYNQKLTELIQRYFLSFKQPEERIELDLCRMAQPEFRTTSYELEYQAFLTQKFNFSSLHKATNHCIDSIKKKK